MTKSFNNVCIEGEWLDGFEIIDIEWDKDGICKRCGEPFIKKYKKQIFCSQRCVSRYENKMNKMKEKHGKAFTDWLNNKVDCSYSPEKF